VELPVVEVQCAHHVQLYGSSRFGNQIRTRHLLQEPLGGTMLPDRWSGEAHASLAAQTTAFTAGG
jgi:hypothetical protein